MHFMFIFFDNHITKVLNSKTISYFNILLFTSMKRYLANSSFTKSRVGQIFRDVLVVIFTWIMEWM